LRSGIVAATASRRWLLPPGRGDCRPSSRGTEKRRRSSLFRLFLFQFQIR
jgi:hypothetical protein